MSALLPRRRLLAGLAGVAGLAGLAATGLLAGCGIPSDARPRDVEQATTTVAYTPDPVPGAGDDVWFLATVDGSERLQAAGRDVPSDPTALLQALLAGLTPGEQEQGLRTWIPRETVLNRAEVLPDGTLVVDLSEPFFGAAAESQTKAVAQVVFTATGLPGVTGVRITVDGEAVQWPVGDGRLTFDPLSRDDYPELNPVQPRDTAPGRTTSTSTTPP